MGSTVVCLLVPCPCSSPHSSPCACCSRLVGSICHGEMLLCLYPSPFFQMDHHPPSAQLRNSWFLTGGTKHLSFIPDTRVVWILIPLKAGRAYLQFSRRETEARSGPGRWFRRCGARRQVWRFEFNLWDSQGGKNLVPNVCWPPCDYLPHGCVFVYINIYTGIDVIKIISCSKI